jgi:hypothetical protein
MMFRVQGGSRFRVQGSGFKVEEREEFNIEH